MSVLETVLSKRWILKSKEKELYYKVKDEIGSVKRFLNEKLGYQVIVNPYLIKVEKTPSKAEPWMGILEFSETIEYIFLCLILMFLEDKEVEEQFVLSKLTEYIQSSYTEETVDWTLYRYRRHLIKVIKYCIKCGMIKVNDGDEEGFAKDNTSEVLYENTGASRYFMKNFTHDIMGYEHPEEFEKEEWIDMNVDRGIVRRQRVYRSLVMSPGLYRKEETEEDFIYIRQYRNMVSEELSNLFDCELHVHKSSAFLVLKESSKLGKAFPEENTLSDIILLCNEILLEYIAEQEQQIPEGEIIFISKEVFRQQIEQCKHKYEEGFIKSYREMTSGEFVKEVEEYMKQLNMIKEYEEGIEIYPIIGKVIGKYPKDFKLGGKDE